MARSFWTNSGKLQPGLAGAIFFCVLGVSAGTVSGQVSPSSPLLETGQISMAGRPVPYRIRNLPVNAFPDLPAPIAEALTERGCLIPQTYEAKRPENVIHGSLERAGSNDWAVLCSAQGRVKLLVFFASVVADKPAVLADAAEMDRLQPHDLSGVLGFNWGIDPASPSRIHDAEAGMAHRPPLPDHDCVADTTVDRQTVYHLYRNGAWDKVELE